jgi:cell division protein FtsB
MGGARVRRRTVRRGRRAWLVAVAALALVGFLYYRPVKAYIRAQDALQDRAAEVRRLSAERTKLRRRLALDGTGATLVREARRLGLVRPDEHLFIVKGIDAWRRARAAERADERG